MFRESCVVKNSRVEILPLIARPDIVSGISFES